MLPTHRLGTAPQCPFNSGLGHGIFIDANLHKYKLIIKTNQKTKTVQNKKIKPGVKTPESEP